MSLLPVADFQRLAADRHFPVKRHGWMKKHSGQGPPLRVLAKELGRIESFNTVGLDIQSLARRSKSALANESLDGYRSNFGVLLRQYVGPC